jgi:hypothetical protein
MDGVIPLSRLPEALAAVSQICKRYRFDVANAFSMPATAICIR